MSIAESPNGIEREHLVLEEHAERCARESLFRNRLLQYRVGGGKLKALRGSGGWQRDLRRRHGNHQRCYPNRVPIEFHIRTNLKKVIADACRRPSILVNKGTEVVEGGAMGVREHVVTLVLLAGIAVAQGQTAATQPAPSTGPQPSAAQPPTPQTFTVPAGTKVLLSLKSAINTKTAQQGDGVYLVSSFPVVGNARVMIPVGVYVQGVVDRVVRPGRVKGRAQLDLHFTTMIFPNGQIVDVPGVLNSLPGSDGPKVKGNEGTVEQAGNKGRDVANVLKGAAIGAEGGVIGGAASGDVAKGVGYGSLAGAAAGTIYTLFTRGNDIVIPTGTSVEMVLQRPLVLQESQLAGLGDSRGQAQMVPGNQQQPLPKRKQRILCPFGSPGCD